MWTHSLFACKNLKLEKSPLTSVMPSQLSLVTLLWIISLASITLNSNILNSRAFTKLSSELEAQVTSPHSSPCFILYVLQNMDSAMTRAQSDESTPQIMNSIPDTITEWLLPAAKPLLKFKRVCGTTLQLEAERVQESDRHDRINGILLAAHYATRKLRAMMQKRPSSKRFYLLNFLPRIRLKGDWQTKLRSL